MRFIRNNRLLAAAAVAILSGMLYIPLQAHDTGNERRTGPQCKKLNQKALIDNCLACIARPVPHHFHPNRPAGERCRANDGTP